MTDYTELKRLAEAFPADLDWDSNTEPFFNGPSGESLGAARPASTASTANRFALKVKTTTTTARPMSRRVPLISRSSWLRRAKASCP